MVLGEVVGSHWWSKGGVGGLTRGPREEVGAAPT